MFFVELFHKIQNILSFLQPDIGVILFLFSFFVLFVNGFWKKRSLDGSNGKLNSQNIKQKDIIEKNKVFTSMRILLMYFSLK